MASPLPRLTLVGTVHGDATAAGRLRVLLDRLAPTVLTLEMSPYSLAWRWQRSACLLQLLDERMDELRREAPAAETAGGRRAIEAIRTLLTLPYEYRAASDYAEREGVPLRLIDLSAVAKRKLARVEEELLTPANLRVLIELPEEEESVGEGHEVAARFLDDRYRVEARRAYLDRRRGVEEIGLRDRWMARQLRRQLATMDGGHLVHIGGWIHLLTDDRRGETLYSLLADRQPRRILLEREEGETRP